MTPKEINEWLNNEKYLNEMMLDIYSTAFNLGGWQDRKVAIEKALELNLVEYPFEAGEYIGKVLDEYRNEFDAEVDTLDPVDAVYWVARMKSEDELYNLGFKNVEFVVDANYCSTSVYLDDADSFVDEIKEKLENEEITIDELENLSSTTKALLEECNVNINEIIAEYKEEQEQSDEVVDDIDDAPKHSHKHRM